MNYFSIHTSMERKIKVYELVFDGSDPRSAFFVLVAISTLIAAFGLILDNAAVIIGAMLVAPLMMPILGVALALLRGDPRLLALSLRSEALGVFLAVLVSYLVGLSIPYIEVTPQMLSRTNPDLLDLLVALLAGLAGAYAVLDEKISPALPGVAISVSIVPPLANTGLALSLGSYQGALGSFVLFFANFLAILLATALIFYLGGMAVRLDLGTRYTVARRFGLAVIGFLIVGIFLSREFLAIVRDDQLKSELREVAEEQFAQLRASSIQTLAHEYTDGILNVLAHIHAPAVATPRQIQEVERKIGERLGKPIRLFVRTTLTQNITATGSMDAMVEQTLDGFNFSEQSDSRVQNLKIAEQRTREYLNDKLGITLTRLESFLWGPDTVFLAQVSGMRSLRPKEIAELEQLIQNAINGRVHLLVAQENIELSDKQGPLHTEFATRRYPSPEEEEAMEKIHTLALEFFESSEYSLFGWSVVRLGDRYHALFEVRGPQMITPDTVRRLKDHLTSRLDVPLEIFVRSVPEAVLTEHGYTDLDNVLAQFGKLTREAYDQETNELIETWR